MRSFVPRPLPPEPPVRLEGSLRRLLESAAAALGRLDAISRFTPDKDLFLYSYVRREALLSSQIEGTQASLADLILDELEDAPGMPSDDVREVSNCVASGQHAIFRLREGFPLSCRLLRETHQVLLASGRGSHKAPGEFRRSQNWIGGTRPGNAVFVPPPPTAVPDCMAELERFLHSEADSLPALVRAGLAHVQFETIHPFLDGNGRVGRLLIVLTLCDADLLQEPILYLSLYLKQHRSRYYELLTHVRSTGDWESWLTFFLEGVLWTARDAVRAAERILAVLQADRGRIRALRTRRAASALRVHEVLAKCPVLTVREASRRASVAFATASSAMRLLADQGIAQEITGLRRNRVFAYAAYLAILNEGAEETG